GRNIRMGFGVDIGINSERYATWKAFFRCDSPNRLQFFQRFDVDPEDRLLNCLSQLCLGLADSTEDNSGWRCANLIQAKQLTSRYNIEAGPFLVKELEDR